MRFLSTILMFAGYALVYASVANGGKFATEPWAGLFSDAYTATTDNPQGIVPTPGQAEKGITPDQLLRKRNQNP